MEQSILKSTKKLLGIDPDDESFDLDIITHINSTFFILHDLGVGPASGFVIEDDEPLWADFIDPDEGRVFSSTVRTYVYLKVRLVFDPPGTSFLLEAINKQIQELEWRLSVNRESIDWTDPDPHIPDPDDIFEGTLPIVVDGGDAF